MPAVIDAPEILEHDEHELHDKQPSGSAAHRGFWYNVMQYVRRHRVHTSTGTRSSSRVAMHQLESPMARLAQEHPTLYLLGFCGIHSG
jgi:hypothetical protein